MNEDINFEKCIICQDSTFNIESVVKDPKRETIEKLLEIIEERAKLKDLIYVNLQIRLIKFTKETIFENNPKWHRSCYQKATCRIHIKRLKDKLQCAKECKHKRSRFSMEELAKLSCSASLTRTANESTTETGLCQTNKKRCFANKHESVRSAVRESATSDCSKHSIETQNSLICMMEDTGASKLCYVKSFKETINWYLCIICQEHCHKKGKIVENIGLETYQKLIDAVETRASLHDGKYVEIHQYFKEFSKEILMEKNAKWHKSCYSDVIHKKKIQQLRNKLQHEDTAINKFCSAKDDIRHVESTEKSKLCQVSASKDPVDWEYCIICQDSSARKGIVVENPKLKSCETLLNLVRQKACAQNRKYVDIHLYLKDFNKDTLMAKKPRWHRNCYLVATNLQDLIRANRRLQYAKFTGSYIVKKRGNRFRRFVIDKSTTLFKPFTRTATKPLKNVFCFFCQKVEVGKNLIKL